MRSSLDCFSRTGLRSNQSEHLGLRVTFDALRPKPQLTRTRSICTGDAMALDLTSVGFTTEPHSYTYDWKSLALYALGIGAKRDELAYLYENTPGGIASYPTFAVIPAHGPLFQSLVRTGGNMAIIWPWSCTGRRRFVRSQSFPLQARCSRPERFAASTT
jgi:hypothetical protein